MSTTRNAIRATTLAALLAVALPCAAAAPTKLRFSVDDTFPSTRYTNACGFPVVRHDEGDVQILLTRAQNGGQIVGEIDTVPGYKITLSAPGTGGSFTSTVSSVLKSSYPDGVYVGAPALLVFVGLQFRAPGLAQAGREVYAAEIAFVDEAGVPFTEPTELLESNGHFTDFASFAAVVCEALANP